MEIIIGGFLLGILLAPVWIILMLLQMRMTKGKAIKIATSILNGKPYKEKELNKALKQLSLYTYRHDLEVRRIAERLTDFKINKGGK